MRLSPFRGITRANSPFSRVCEKTRGERANEMANGDRRRRDQVRARERERERERGREGKGRREARTKGARASARETEGMSVNDATRRKGYTDTTGTRKKAGDTTRRSGRDKERRA